MSPPDSLEVVIGPSIDLHEGIHGALLSSPPPGISYARRDGEHVFLFPQGSAYPDVFETPHWGELVALSDAAPLVHSARWPVLRARAWVADMDDFGYPVLGGRTLFNERTWPRFRREVSRPGGPSAGDPIRLRLTSMLRAYAHPSCRGILFGTKVGLGRAAKILSDLGAGADGEAFLRKSRVLGPAMPPSPRARVLEKWQEDKGINVLFCGVGWQLKNGPLAIRVMARMAVKHPKARFLYVGDTPPEVRGDERRRALPPNMRLVGKASPEHVKTLFDGAHILFHPSRSESFGMVLLEAAAAGLAIVCARGHGMEHLDEIVDERGASTVDRETVSERDEEERFAAHLDALLTERALARAKGLWNHAHVEGSLLSSANRNAVLAAVYDSAVGSAAPEGLHERDLVADRPAELLRLTSREVREAEIDLRARTAAEAVGYRIEVQTTPATPMS